MRNFVFQNTTKLIFGKGTIAELSGQIPFDKRILVTFGGGSVRENGVYDRVIKALDGYQYVEFWGIEPNPSVETLRKAISVGKENKVDYLLAVGGGSVLDGTKLIAGGILYDGDAWDLVLRGGPKECLPVGAVLTLPATGSEMNRNAVISKTETREKYGMVADNPVFSILDPEVTYTLPERQIAAGIADTFVHVAEQYMTTPDQSHLMDRWAEGILSTLVELAPRIRADRHNYDNMAEFMLCATMALNGFISMGVTQDWATHGIGHEITALHGLTHGATLAIVLPGLLRVMGKQKETKLLQYGERVWGIGGGTVDERVHEAVARTEGFFRSLGLSTRLGEEGIGEDTIAEIERRFNERGTALGENRNITGTVVREILESCK